MKKYIALPLTLLLLTGLTGCSPVKMPKMNKYTIMNYQQKIKQSRSHSRATLLVTTPSANAGYQSNHMIYMITPQELQFFANHQWVAPPSEMLLPLFTKAVQNRGFYYAVVASPFTGVTNYRLDTKVLTLQQEFLQPRSYVRLVVQASLINNQNNKLLASHVFRVLMPTGVKSPYGGVLATISASNKIAKQIARFAVRKTPK